MRSQAFALFNALLIKSAVDFSARRDFKRDGSKITLTGLPEIIRKALLHLTINSHLFIRKITSTASAGRADNHAGKYIRVITLRA